MGAVGILVQSKGKSMKEAFNAAVEEAIYDYGHDAYNGAINNCTFTKDVTKRYLEAEDKQLFIDEHELEIDKHEVHGVYLGGDDYLFIGVAPC